MYTIKNFTDNDDISVINQLGPFTVVEYTRDLSVMPGDAMIAYYCNEMNVRKRQVIPLRYFTYSGVVKCAEQLVLEDQNHM